MTLLLGWGFSEASRLLLEALGETFFPWGAVGRAFFSVVGVGGVFSLLAWPRSAAASLVWVIASPRGCV